MDEAFDILLDDTKNQDAHNTAIHQANSRIKLYVIATNEELQIALESAKLIKKS